MTEERTKMQKMILVILAAMILLFGVLNVVSLFRKGVVFDEHLLRIHETENATVYSGKVHREEVSVTVRSDLQQVEYTVRRTLIRILWHILFPRGSQKVRSIFVVCMQSE